MKLKTTTPRVVGVLIDLEHLICKLYTDFQLKSSAKEAALSPGEWTPYIKIKRKGNIAILNPFCALTSSGLAADAYQCPNPAISYQYSKTAIILNLKDDTVTTDDFSYIKTATGFADSGKVKLCFVAKNKDKKCLKVGLVEFNSEEALEQALAEWNKKVGESKIEYLHGEKLCKAIIKMWNKEKKLAQDAIGVKYKVKKITPVILAEKPEEKVTAQPPAEPQNGAKAPLLAPPVAPPVKKEEPEVKQAEAIPLLPPPLVKTEAKTSGDIPPPKPDEAAIKPKSGLTLAQFEALKVCLSELNQIKIKEYKEAVTLLLKGANSPKVELPRLEQESESVEAVYLPQSDNLLLVKGSMMKIVEREHGHFCVPANSFYNCPTKANSQIALKLGVREARFLLQKMKWRGLGEFLGKSYTNAVYEFLFSLVDTLKAHSAESNVYLPMTYLAAKLTLDSALQALSSEILYREDPSLAEQRDHNQLRLFALTPNTDLEYITSIFCHIDQELWSMAQNSQADSSIKSLWTQVPSKIHNAYTRLLSFQNGKERLPDDKALAEAGLILREDSTLVHFEEPSTEVDGIYELANKESPKELWETLSNQFPDSKLLSGKISCNVPIHYTLNSFPFALHSKMQKINSIVAAWKHPIMLVGSSEGCFEVWNTKLGLNMILKANMAETKEEIWKSYGAAKLTNDKQATNYEFVPYLDSEENYSLANLFGGEDEMSSDTISPASLMNLAAEKKEQTIEMKNLSLTHGMLLFSEETAKTLSPVRVAAIITDKATGKQLIKIRKYGYFSAFYDSVLKLLDGFYITAFDSKTYHSKDQAIILSRIFEQILTKAYTFSPDELSHVFGLISEENYPLTNNTVIAAYAVAIPGITSFAFNVFSRDPKEKEIMLNVYEWKEAENSFKEIKSKNMGFAGKEVKIEYSNEVVIIASADGVKEYTLVDVEMLGEIAENIISLKNVHLQGDTVIIQRENKAELFIAKKEKSEKKEGPVEVVAQLTRDIKPEEVTSIDLAAYGNVEGTISIGTKGEENDSAKLCSIIPERFGEDTKQSWCLLKDPKEVEFEFDMGEIKEVENLDVELCFSKEGLSPEECEKINSTLSSEEKKGEQEKKKISEGDETHLPLVVVWHKGASHNHTMSVSKIFSIESKEFKSNYPQPAFIFGHQHSKQFIIKKCVIKSPVTSGDKCHPIGSGIIYTSNHLSAFKHATHNFAKTADYTAWLTKRKEINCELQPYEPAGFFEMDEGNEMIFSLDVQRPCKYIYLKPTGFRSKPTELKQFASYPMTIEYFGVSGTVIESGLTTQPAWAKYLEIQSAKINVGCKLEIFALSEKEKSWQKLGNIENIELQALEKKDKAIKRFDKENSASKHTGKWHLVYEEKELHKAITSKYKLKITQPEGAGKWKLDLISVSAYASKKVERQGELFKHISSAYLWKCMNDPELFSRVNKALCELVCMPEREYNDRIKTMSLLRKVMESSQEQLELVKKHIKLDKFIRANIFQDQTESFALKFLQAFNQFPDFCQELHDFVTKEIQDIHKIALKPAAVAGLKSILSIVISKNPELFLVQLISKIYEISTKYLESILTEEQIFLKTRLGIESYPLSPCAWNAPAHTKSDDKTLQAFGEGKKMPASIRCGYSYTANSCRFVLDCIQVHNINTAILYFKKDPSNILSRFSISIYGIQEPTSTTLLLYEKEYPSFIWERVTNAAYSQDKTKFDEKDELDSLSIPIGSFVGRYIIIDAVFKKAHDALMGSTWNINEFLKDGLIAEVYGIPQSREGKAVPEIDALMKVEEQQKTSKRIGHSANYEKIQSNSSFIDLYRLKMEGQAGKVDVKQTKGEENVGLQLASTQKQLQKEIKKYKDGQTPKEAVLDLVSQIESMQRLQCQLLSKEQIEGDKCVEYLVHICIEMANIVTDIVNKNPQLLHILKKQTACNVVTLIKTLFRDFIVFNSGYPRSEMLAFIQNVLLQEASEAEWIKLLLEIVEDFLSKSETVYSQTSVIACLEKFNIPEGELLSYLAKKMKLKETMSSQLTEERKRSNSRDQLEREIFPELSTTLVLAIKSLRKQPVEDVDAVVHRGISCIYCGNNKPIVGMRYKCGHCPNVNICSKSHCIKKHSDEQKDHVLIAIPKPLPYSPAKTTEAVLYKPLLPPMKLQHATKVHDGIECDNCGLKNFEGNRYLCSNCDYYNLCEKCYLQEKFSHTKTHVFLRLPIPLLQSETATPKALIAHLDPQLYPLQKQSTEPPMPDQLEMRRSTSVKMERRIDYEKLDIDQTLQVAYRICIWVCHTKMMDNKQNAIALRLSADLLSILLKLSSVDTVSALIQEDTQLENIIHAYLSVEDDKAVRISLVKLIITSLKNVSIKSMTQEEIKEMSQVDRGEYLTKLEKTLTIRSHVSTCLHQILKSLIENAPKGKAVELIDMDNLALLLDSYISVLDSISSTKELLKKYKVIKEDDLIAVPILTRSFSLPATPATKRPKMNLTKPSLQLALGLISMLESLSPSSIGSMYGKMWEIVLKILSKINMKQVISAKLFERLMNSFFLSNSHIQETIYRQLLDISSKMMQFPNMSTLIINLIRSTLENAVNTTREEISFYICRGWLDILISGSSPKPAKKDKEKDKDKEKSKDKEKEKEKEKEKKDASPVKKVEVFAALSQSDILDLFTFFGNFLMNSLNFGSYKGIMGGRYKVVYRALLNARIASIISNAKSKGGDKLALQELVETCKDPKLSATYSNLMIWLFLNYCSDDTSCKLMELVCKISKHVKELFKCVSCNENLCKSLLGTLQEIVTSIDKGIQKKVETGEIRINLAVELSNRVNRLLKRMMKYLMSSKSAATYFAFELKGFDFLFNRLGIVKEKQTENEGRKTPVVESDIMEGICETIQVPLEVSEKVELPEAKSKKEQISPEMLLDEDFAKDMNLIECTGETNLSSLHHINWCTYKGGQRSKIYTKQLKEGVKHEVVMAFELKKLIEIKEIQLAFINFWGMDNYEHLDVSSVTVEIGTSKNSYSYLCTLDKVNDKSIEVQGVTVFGINMSTFDETITKSDPVVHKLNSLKNARGKYIKFIIRTGVKVAFSGTQASKSCKQKAIGVNYFSILGYDFGGVSQVEKYLSSKNQKVAYKLLNMFQNKTFRGCLKEFATIPAITNQLKVNFHTLASLMTPEKSTIEPFLIALCSHNADLGKWILQELIRSRESKGSALFMVQICLSNIEKVNESQDLVLSYIFKELEQLEQKRNDKPDAPKSLAQFTLHYVSLLYLVSPLLTKEFIINATEKDLLLIYRQIMFYWETPEIKEPLIKLFLVLLHPPAKIISKISILDFVTKYLILPKDQHSLLLASYLTVFEKDIGRILLEIIPSEISIQNEQTAYDQLAILLNLTMDKTIQSSLVDKKLALTLYEKLKNPQDKQTYMHQTSASLMQLADELIKKCVNGHLEYERKLAEAMIQDLGHIKNIEEKEALSKLILNLMRAEKTIPVCLYNYDSECEQWKSLTVDDTLRKGKKKTFFLDTPLLLQKHKDVLMGVLRDRICLESDAERLIGANWKLIFKEQGNPQQNSPERFSNFFEAVGGKGPFLVIMSGTSEGKRAIVGAFTTTSFPPMPDSFQNGQTLEIKGSPESVFFYYSENMMNHFEMKNKGENFGYIYVDYTACGACVLGNYFLSFSYSYSYSNSIGSMSSLKCIDGNVTYLPYSFFIDSIEIWACEQDTVAVGGEDACDKDFISPLNKVTASEHAWYSSKTPYQSFRPNAVFNVPAHISVKELGECIIGKTNIQMKLRNSGKALEGDKIIKNIYEEAKDSLSCGIMDVEFEIDKEAKDILKSVGYKPETPILAHFEGLGGYITLIDAAKSSLDQWKNKKLSQMFQLYLEELMQFSKLSDFFKTLLSNKRSKTFIFEIMAGTPDRDTSGKAKKEGDAKEKKWEEEYNSAVSYCYMIISELFANSTNVDLRKQAAQSDFIPLILTRLQKLSGENTRKWEESVALRKESSTTGKELVIQGEDPTKKKARKGVGYSTQVGEIWDVDKYMKSKKTKNKQIESLIKIVSNFISCEKWEPDDQFVRKLCESALLPLIETSLSSGSLLEMAKESDLILSYLDLLDKFRENPKLATLLVELDPHYSPPQREPLYKVLKNLNELSGIFVKCMEKEVEINPENEVPKQLAEKIQKCYKKVMRVVEKMQQEKKGEAMKNILALPLPKAYRALLRDLRFGYTNMRDEKGKYKHFYHAQAEHEATASQNKLIRLAQELADLSNALPEDHTNAIFIRVDDQRIDYMKAIVMGACNTPYAHGAFEYDIYCPSNYPNEPPKMNLTTTGKGAVRFNPNLYHDGKVCLSLLGTWRGTATENWDAKFSTILQVLMSLQAIVMSEEVYFNEPGFEGEIGKPEGERKNEAYSNVVRYNNIKFAMIGQIKNPPKGFETVIKRHFYLKKDEIMKEVQKWVEFAGTHDAAYEGLVYDHNSEWCNKFKQSKTRYKEMLTEAVKELEQTLNSIEPPKDENEETTKEEVKGEGKVEGTTAFKGGVSVEGVDVTEDTAEELKKKMQEKQDKLSIEDPGVKDRWSRYIGAIGIDAVAKQAKSSILVSGAGGLGIEIAKNIVLSGCKEFILQDSKLVTMKDLSAQFFLMESDVGKNRAAACITRLQQLNYYVKVGAITTPLPLTEAELDTQQFSRFSTIVLTDCDYDTHIALDLYCRKHKIALIIADVKGVLCKIVNDFGENFEVLDQDGEEPKECMIKEITNEEFGLVTTITGQRHGFANGDTIIIKE